MIPGSGGKHRAVGTVGAPGQARGVSARNWKCGECGADNYASRAGCYRCKSSRPLGSSTEGEAAVNPADDNSPWREALDPRTHQIYYWNVVTKETAWSRPAELGPAPHGTGFFGRGAAGVDVQAGFMRRNAEWLQRPARQQSTVDPKTLQRAEGANELNIWYGKHLGEHWKTNPLGKDAAPTRCVPDTDVGYTKASRNTSERGAFCMHFARGACHRGSDCTFYHHIPTAEDDGVLAATHDVFGRTRHTSHRDDMSGIGDIHSDCRTLFVGGIKKVAGYDVRAALEKHFGAWGELENINVIDKKSIAFVRFRGRASAEFAREAMANQALDANEVLNLRWAFDDPNPIAKDASLRADADAVLAAMAAKGQSLAPAAFDYPADYALPAYSDAVSAGDVSMPLADVAAAIASANVPPAGRSAGVDHQQPQRRIAPASANMYTDSARSGAVALYPDTDAQYDDDASHGNYSATAVGTRGYVVAEATPLLSSYASSAAVARDSTAPRGNGATGQEGASSAGVFAGAGVAAAAGKRKRGDELEGLPSFGTGAVAEDGARVGGGAGAPFDGVAAAAAPPSSAAAEDPAAASADLLGIPRPPPGPSEAYSAWYYQVYAPAYQRAATAAAAASVPASAIVGN